MPYSQPADLLTGDIPLPGRYGDGAAIVQQAADEIDAQIGHIYVTPVVLNANEPENRPAILLLKKINNLLASGRIILDMAAGSEDDSTHAYGRSMWEEAVALLNKLSNQSIPLRGAEFLESRADDPNTKISIINADDESLVEQFYRNFSNPGPVLRRPTPIYPYGKE